MLSVEASIELASPRAFRQELNNRLDRSSRAKTFVNAHFLELLLIGWRNDSADDHADVRHVRVAQCLEHLRDQRHVGTVENADAQPIDVLVLGRLGHRFTFCHSPL